MPQPREVYDPSIAAIEDQLLNPPDYTEILKTALQYGIKHIDLANPAGVNLEDGEMIVIRGRKKNRKTTLALNLVRHWCRSGDRLQGGKILWETLESGQTPRKVKQALICMEATAYMAGKIYKDVRGLPKLKAGMDDYTSMDALRDVRDPAHSQEGAGNLFKLSPEYAKSVDRTPLQHEAIQEAIERVNKWPLLLYGAPRRQGGTKILEGRNGGESLDGLLPYSRWQRAVKDLGVKIIVVDHVNAYNVINDYDKANKAVMHASAIIGEFNVVFLAASQVSLTSIRVDGQQETRGGTKWSEEGNTIVDIWYKQHDNKVKIGCGAARDAPFPDIYVPVEMNSGLFFPDSYLARPGL